MSTSATCEHCRRGGAEVGCGACHTPYCSREHQAADWQAGHAEICDHVAQFRDGAFSAAKAREMLRNPPHNKPLSKKQKRFFEGVAHGWHPSHMAGW